MCKDHKNKKGGARHTLDTCRTMSLIRVQIKVTLTMLTEDMVKNQGFDVINNIFIII